MLKRYDSTDMTFIRSTERRLRKAILRGLERTRESVSINDLALALSAGSSRRAARLLPTSVVVDKASPVATILRDAVLRGGRLSARFVNDDDG